MAETQDSVARSIRLHLADMQRSQRWLADQLGESTHWLSRRMRGLIRFNTDDIDRIAAVLKVDALDLLTGSAPRRKKAVA